MNPPPIPNTVIDILINNLPLSALYFSSLNTLGFDDYVFIFSGYNFRAIYENEDDGGLSKLYDYNFNFDKTIKNFKNKKQDRIVNFQREWFAIKWIFIQYLKKMIEESDPVVPNLLELTIKIVEYLIKTNNSFELDILEDLIIVIDHNKYPRFFPNLVEPVKSAFFKAHYSYGDPGEEIHRSNLEKFKYK